MKKTLLNMTAVALTICSSNTFADKLTITGEPIVLQKSGDMYTVPADYNATTSYHYVTLDNTQRVCFADARPDYASLNMVDINVMVNGAQVVWHCYEYNPDYFLIDSTATTTTPAATTPATTTTP